MSRELRGLVRTGKHISSFQTHFYRSYREGTSLERGISTLKCIPKTYSTVQALIMIMHYRGEHPIYKSTTIPCKTSLFRKVITSQAFQNYVMLEQCLWTEQFPQELLVPKQKELGVSSFLFRLQEQTEFESNRMLNSTLEQHIFWSRSFIAIENRCLFPTISQLSSIRTDLLQRTHECTMS